jgi:hypothetical protein
VDQRRLLACCEGGQGVVYVVIAVGRPPLYLLLPLVIVASTLAALMAPAGRAACPGLGGRPSKPKSGSELVSGLLVAEDTFDDFGVLGVEEHNCPIRR